MKIVLISGPVAVGKSSIADELVQSHHFHRIRSGNYLSGLARSLNSGSNRTALQDLGDKLDNDTDYRWLIDEVAAPTILAQSYVGFWLLDCVRKHKQVAHFRERYGHAIFHVHLDAPDELLKSRYELRVAAGAEYIGNTSYDDAIAHPNEVAARSLKKMADQVVDVSDKSASEVAAAIAAGLVTG